MFGQKYIKTIFLAFIFFISQSAFAGMRCGTNLIQVGDSVLQLLEHCGEPQLGNPIERDYAEWTYNFGPDEFMMRVIIRDNEIVRIESLESGFVETDTGYVEGS